MHDAASDPRDSPARPRPSGRGERLRRWVILDGNRLLVSGVLFAVFVASIAALQTVGIVPLRSIRPTFYLFGGLVGGNLTLITVVVSINQLLLSREFNTPGELRSQIEDVVDYRRNVEKAAGRIAPVDPLGFLRLLVESTREEVQRIGGLSVGEVQPGAREDIDDLAERLTSRFDEVDRLLQQSGSNTFEVLSATLETNYAEQVRQVRELRADHGADLPEELVTILDRLVDRLEEIDVARQYFKALYLQEELSALSRILLYVGLPAEAATAFVLLSYTAGGGSSLPADAFATVFPLAVGLGFLPLFVLASYVVRAATIAQRTAATLPFTTPDQEVWPTEMGTEE